MYSAMLQPPEWIQGSPIKRIRQAIYRFQYKRRIRRHARTTALRPVHRLQARTQQTMGSALRARKQPPRGQPIYNADLQRTTSTPPWWARKEPLSELLEKVQATPRQK